MCKKFCNIITCITNSVKNIKRQKSHNEATEAILADEVQKNETAITSGTNDRDSNEENM